MRKRKDISMEKLKDIIGTIKHADKIFVLGIDPGIYGAGCLMSLDGKHILPFQLSTSKNRNYANKTTKAVDALAFYQMLEHHRKQIYFCVVESPLFMPFQSVKSTFKIGEIFGTIVSILELLDLPVTFITAKEWQKSLLQGIEGEDIKDRSIKKAMELGADIERYNKQAKSGLADAVCIAAYGREIYLKDFFAPTLQR
jgi:hypothetical protein